jgi:microcystin-dependent protein
MRGNLDMGDNPLTPVFHKVINMAAGTDAGDGVNKSQLDALQTFLDGLEGDLTGCLFTDGTNAMAAPLNMGGFRVEFVGEPINVGDGVTKNYHDTVFNAISTGFVHRDGSLAMLGNLNLGGFKVTNLNLSAPTQDGDGVSRGYLLAVLSAIAVTPPGTIAAFAGDEISLPAGWLIANGQAVSRTTYAGLFAVVGTTYGVGNGSTTFNLPDFRGRVAIGKDNMGGTSGGVVNNPSADVLGGAMGAETVTLVVNDLPAHTHSYNDKVVGNGTGGSDLGPANTNTTSLYTDITGRTTSSTGSGQAHNNMQPSIAMNIIIKF